MGVWLPLALAGIASLMYKTIQMWAAKPDEVKMPKRSELLESWALPFMASALKAGEEELERREKAEKVKAFKAQLAAMQEKYGRSENADQVHQ